VCQRGCQADVAAVDAGSQVDPALLQPDTDSGKADAGCQALLLSTAGLPVVGQPAPCRVCPLVQQQLTEAQKKQQQAQQQEQQVRPHPLDSTVNVRHKSRGFSRHADVLGVYVQAQPLVKLRALWKIRSSV